MLNHLPPRRLRRGFTLVELVVVILIAAVLATLCYPGMAAVVQRIHRSDALGALARIQLLQQRHRSLHPQFATLEQLGVGSTLAGGRYQLELSEPTGHGYVLTALAQAAQASDIQCRRLQIVVSGVDTLRASGPDAKTDNDLPRNRRCWGQ